MILADAIAVTAIARDPAAMAAGRAYRVLAELAPALALSTGSTADAIMRLDAEDVASLASDWARERGLSKDLAHAIAAALPDQPS